MTTAAQHKVYSFIKRFIQQQGYSPSLTTIATGVGVRSRSLIHRQIHALKAAGLIQLKPGKSRRVREIRLPAEPKSSFSIPLLGRIAAGVPIEAISENETTNVVDLLASVHRMGQYALKVKGDSMIDEGILDGDIILCESRATAHEGEIVVALVDNHEATLKRIYFHKNGTVTLKPANSALKPQKYATHRVKIQGIFIGLLRINAR